MFGLQNEKKSFAMAQLGGHTLVKTLPTIALTLECKSATISPGTSKRFVRPISPRPIIIFQIIQVDVRHETSCTSDAAPAVEATKSF